MSAFKRKINQQIKDLEEKIDIISSVLNIKLQEHITVGGSRIFINSNYPNTDSIRKVEQQVEQIREYLGVHVIDVSLKVDGVPKLKVQKLDKKANKLIKINQ